MEVNNIEQRIGRFTSSQISRLCGSNGNPSYKVFSSKQAFKDKKRASRVFETKEDAEKYVKTQKGKPHIEFIKPNVSKAFYTYIEEVQIARAIGRSTKTVVKTQAMKWGKVMEVVLFNLLGMEYTMEHKSTVLHPVHGDFWSGTPDLVVPKVKTGEIKCFEPLHFGKLSLALKTKDTETIKDKEPEVYWQSISNSLLCGVDKTEIIAYMPYKSELREILDQIENSNFLERNGLEPTDYYFMREENIESLPYLPDDSPMSNINSFEFDLPKHDVEFLTERIIEASKYLPK